MIAYLLEEDKDLTEYSEPRSVGIAVADMEIAMEWCEKSENRSFSKLLVTQYCDPDLIDEYLI